MLDWVDRYTEEHAETYAILSWFCAAGLAFWMGFEGFSLPVVGGFIVSVIGGVMFTRTVVSSRKRKRRLASNLRNARAKRTAREARRNERKTPDQPEAQRKRCGAFAQGGHLPM